MRTRWQGSIRVNGTPDRARAQSKNDPLLFALLFSSHNTHMRNKTTASGGSYEAVTANHTKRIGERQLWNTRTIIRYSG